MRFIFFICFCLGGLNVSSALAKETFAGPVEAEVLRVLDGDTLDVRVTIWIGQRLETRVRLISIDTPELRGKCQEEKDLAQKAKQALKDYVASGRVVLKNVHFGKFAGRVLAQAQTVEGEDIADLMIKNGYARPYNGKKRGSWCH